MPISTTEIISGATLLLAIGSALWQRYGIILDLKKEQGSMALKFEEKISALKEKYNTDISILKDNLTTHFSSQVDALYGQLDKLAVQLVTIDKRITKQEMKMELFWSAVQDNVKDMLKQPVHFRKDDLLDRFKSLNYQELCELKNILTEEKISLFQKESMTPEKKIYLISLALMLAGIDSKLIDMETKC